MTFQLHKHFDICNVGAVMMCVMPYKTPESPTPFIIADNDDVNG
jgi:hypothetical protein